MVPDSESRRRTATLRENTPIVVPSLLLCDFGHLEREIRAVEAAGARCLHLDVMDGIFVPNITYGMTIVSAVRRLSHLPLDVHMMTARPGDFVDAMADAGADILTIHTEAVDDAAPLLEQIRSAGLWAGLALNPDTPLSAVTSSLPHCDVVLVMSVAPGFGAQEFDSTALEKLRTLKQTVDERVILEVDGGINAATIADCAKAGAQMFVAGSAIFRDASATYEQHILELTKLATVQ